MKDARYFDTRISAPGVFAAKENEDYGTMIRERYNISKGWPSPGAVEQAIHAAINAQRRDGVELFALGPNAGALAAFIEEVSKHTVTVQVI